MQSATLPSLVSLVLVACSSSTARAAQGPPVGQPGTFPVSEIRAMQKHTVLHETFVPEAPLGIGAELGRLVPADNPLTRAKVELGYQLFFDPRLSKDERSACASCHHPASAWAGSLPRDDAPAGKRRDVPSIANRILGTSQYRDGRARTLEEQALAALANPAEMGFTPEDAAARLGEIEGYRLEFEAVFGGPPTPERIAKALAAFERTILAGESRNDVYERALPFLGDAPEGAARPGSLQSMHEALAAEEQQRMSESALRGRELFFGKAGCSACHSGADLGDERFHNLGAGMQAAEPDLGRFLVTKKEQEKGAFRTPSLRNVGRTAPYLHDGSLKTLLEVIELHERGGLANPWLSPELEALHLGAAEKTDLVAFLEEGLASPTTPVSVPRLP